MTNSLKKLLIMIAIKAAKAQKIEVTIFGNRGNQYWVMVN